MVAAQKEKMSNRAATELLTSIGRNNEGIVQLDILRIAAIFAVVWLHVCADVVMKADASVLEWWAGNIADAASRWCVLMFVMLSGALLLRDGPGELSPREFYVRRAAKLLPPLIFWTAFYLGYRRLRDHTGWMQLLLDTVKGEPYFHLWFLYMIIGLYAVMPLLRMVVNHSGRGVLVTTAAVIFLTAFLEGSYLYWNAHKAGIEPPHNLLMLWLPYTAYFLTGYILLKWPRRIGIGEALGCAAICSVLLALLTAYVHFRMGWRDAYFTYLAFDPLVIGASVVLFACFSTVPIACSPASAAWFRRLAGLTLGIYLVHPLWLAALHRAGPDGYFVHPLVGIPVTAAVAFFLSVLTTAAMRATPMLRRVV
jgi:surface polysaccharide O-acyltransferase-like enzyme